MAVTLRYFTEFGKHAFQHVNAAICVITQYNAQGHSRSPSDGHFEHLRQLCPSPSLHPQLSTEKRLILEPTTYYWEKKRRSYA